jgi:putative two-component system response regulator
MPTMDGFEFLALMNQKGWIKSIPVIMISDPVPTYIERAYDLGALEYISRPFDVRTVRHRVFTSILFTTKQKELSLMVAEQMYEKEKTSHLMVEILASLVEFRNQESGLHVLHIQTITELLLARLREKTDRYHLTDEDCRLIYNASALHDIGKISVPTEILNKPGKLTEEEYAVMKTHTMEGARILQNLSASDDEPLVRFAYQICRWHHERYDGSGYPDGLRGDEIPIAAQVVAVADVYDALTSQRVYKPPYPHQKAVEMIRAGQCGVFNPILMECLSDVSDALQERMHAGAIHPASTEDLERSVSQALAGNDLMASDRTLRALDRTRTKQQFFSELSHEIRFEYSAMPELVTLSDWSAEYLGLPETILSPEESALATQVFRLEDFRQLLDKLRHTTPEDPMVVEQYPLTINGHQRRSKVVARSMWASDGTYEGAIGKIVDVQDSMTRVWAFFENLDEIVYAADMDTNEVVYMNGCARDYFGVDSEADLKGQQCYTVFHGLDSPCDTCTNSQLRPWYFTEWTHHSTRTGKTFLMKDTVIQEDGKRYRVELAIDLTRQMEQN